MITGIFDSLGRYALMLKATFAKPDKWKMYWIEVFRQCNEIGVGSFIIIAIVSTFIGGVTAVQFAYQLKGMSIIPMWWMGAIVRKTMILELAPTLTAMLMAGKVGSNIAAELGSMRINEQIDAMEVMGLNTASYLVGPKTIAGITMFPVMVSIAVFLGIVGGWLAGLAGRFFSTAEYIKGLQDNFDPYDVKIMIVKAVSFGFIIATISCFKGYYVKGGAVEIGKASTQAVVLSSIAVIIVNFFIAFFLL